MNIKNFSPIIILLILLFVAFSVSSQTLTAYIYGLPPSIEKLMEIIEQGITGTDVQMYTLCMNKLDDNDDPKKPGYLTFLGNSTSSVAYKGMKGNPMKITSNTIINRFEDYCYSNNTKLIEYFCETEYRQSSMIYGCIDSQGKGTCVAVENGPDYCPNPVKVKRLKRYSWN